jgi:hypothetical protein
MIEDLEFTNIAYLDEFGTDLNKTELPLLKLFAVRLSMIKCLSALLKVQGTYAWSYFVEYL